MGEHTMYPKSFWKTVKETITKRVGDDIITREISIGMTVESDTRAPSAIIYEKVTMALNTYIDEEHKDWLNQDKMIELLNTNKSKSKTTRTKEEK